MAYLEWGDPENDRVLVCVHGLTRCARDFDQLAVALSDRYRVVCPDVAGRGDSDWLPDPMLYQLPQYVGDMVTLVARLDVESVHWLGTSMGGLIGMAPAFPDLASAEKYMRTVLATFGPHTDAQWSFLTEIVLRKNADGSLRLHYDPKIAEPFRATVPDKDLELWPLWDAIRCPTLVIRGALSDLLTKETCEKMSGRGPKAQVVELPGIGHAPTLLHDDQVGIVRDFLLS